MFNKAEPDSPIEHELRSLMDNGVCLQPLLSLFQSLPTREAFTLLRIATNGVFTDSDLLKCGYDTNPVCTQCFNSMDTIFHRCFSCPSISTRAELALGKDLFDRILAAGDTSLAANRCLYPCPAIVATPSRSSKCTFINFGCGDSFATKDGPVFGDGSCLNGPYKSLARAGFAVAQVDSEGQIIRAIFGCVPAHLPQTALAAEYAAYFTFATHSPGGTYIGDCQEVLSRHNEGLPEALAVDNLHACSLEGPHAQRRLWMPK